MEFVLYPEHILSYYQYLKHNRTGRKYITSKGKEFKTYLQTEITKIMKENKWITVDYPIRIDIIYHFKGKRKRDLDNMKGLFDCLEGIIYEDDSQIYHINATKIMEASQNVIDIKVNKFSLKEYYNTLI